VKTKSENSQKQESLLYRLKRKHTLLVAAKCVFFTTLAALFDLFTPLHIYILICLLLIVELLFARKESFNRIIVAVAFLFGISPNLGWIDTINLNPSYLTAGVWFASFLQELKSKSDLKERQKASFLHSQLIPIIVSLVSFFWFLPLAQGGSEKVLSRLLNYWDHGAHFYFYYSLFVNGSFVKALAEPFPGESWQGSEYPAGIHFVLAKLTSSYAPLSQNSPTSIVPIYVLSVICLHTFALWFSIFMSQRLMVHGKFTFYMRICISLAFLGIYSLTLGSQTFFYGFVNYPAIWIGFSLGISILIKPLKDPKKQVFCLLSTIGILAYNWWPSACLILPIILLSFLSLN
jgi:hypothetical protein